MQFQLFRLVQVSVFLFILLVSTTQDLSAQCPEFTASGLNSPDCFNGSTPCDLCPGDVITLTAEGDFLPNNGCVNWYFGTTPGFNPYNGEGTLIGCGTITAPPPAACSTCPELLAIWIDACGNPEQDNEFMIVSSGSGFNVNNFGVDYDPNNNNVPPSTDDVNTNGGSCNWQTPSAGIIASMQASGNCDASNIIPAGPGTMIPAGVLVVVYNSVNASTSYNFDNLCAAGQTIYVMQSTCARAAGAFSNSSSNGFRTTTIRLNNCNCSSSFTHDTDDPALLGDGDYAYIDNGNVVYENNGCGNPTAPDVEPAVVVYPPATVADVTYTIPASLCNGGPYYVVGIIDPLDANCPDVFTDEFAFNVLCPEATASYSGTPCTGNSITLEAGGGTTYLWSGPNGFSSNNQNPTLGPLTPADAGTYSVTVSNASGCEDIAQVVISVFPEVTVSTNPANPAFCDGQSAVITATGMGGSGNYAFEWDTPNGPGSGPSVVVTSAGTYSVTLTDGNGCTAVATGSITILPGLDVDITPDPATFCAGGNVELTAIPTGGSGGNTYVWLDPSMNPTFTPTVIATLPGTYNVTVTDMLGCTGTSTISVTVNPVPQVSLTSDPPKICAGANVTLTAAGSGGTGGYTFSWTGPGGPGSGNPLVVSQSGTYIVVLTDAAGCQARDTLVLENGTPLTVIFTPNPATFCPGGSVILDAQVQGSQGNPITYTWTTPSGPTSGNPITAAIAGTYAVTVSEQNGCTGTGTISVTENASLNITFTSDTVPICAGGQATLTGIANGGNGSYTYTWNYPGGPTPGNTLLVSNPGTYILQAVDGNNCQGQDSVLVVLANGLTIDIQTVQPALCPGASTLLSITPLPDPSWNIQWNTPLGPNSNYPLTVATPGQYSVAVSDTFGCAGVDTIIIGALDPPVIIINPATPSICPGATVDLSVNLLSGGPITTWSWTTPSGPQMSPVITAGLAGTYTVVVTNSAGCTSSASTAVSISTGLNVTFPAPTLSICTGTQIGLSPIALGGVNPYQYQWMGPTGNATGDTLFTGTPGIYTVTVTDAGGCSGSAMVTLLTGSSLTVNLAPANPGFCAGGDVMLTGDAPGGQQPLVFQWATPLGAGSNPTFLANAAGIYSVTITDANGCSGNASTQVMAWPSPTVTVSPAMLTLCAGQTANLTATATGGFGTYTFAWSGPPGAVIGAIYPNATPGGYGVTVTDDRGCVGQTSMVIGQSPSLSVSIDPPTAVLCPGSSIVVTATGSGGVSPYQYQWIGPAGTITGNPADLNSAGVYLVEVTDDAGCTGSLSFTIGTGNNLNVSIQTSVTSTCGAAPYTATGTVSGGQGPYTYSWSTPQGPGSMPQISLTTAGFIRLTATDMNGCTGEDTVTVSNIPLQLTLSAEPERCPGAGDGMISLEALTNGTLPLQISVNGGASQSVTGLPFILSSLTEGTYALQITDANGCTANPFVPITTLFTPEVSFDPNVVTIMRGSSITLTPVLSFDASQFQWTPGDGLNCTTCEQPVAGPQNTTLYTLQATDISGCRAEGTIEVIVVGNTRVFIPNAISPNADGINDVFFIQAADDRVRVERLEIYDRWGNALFQGVDFPVNDADFGWNGSYRGKPLDPGVYIYTANLIFPDGFQRLYRGDLTLVE